MTEPWVTKDPSDILAYGWQRGWDEAREITDEMVERAAEVIYRADPWPGEPGVWADVAEPIRDDARSTARVALTAAFQQIEPGENR
jgi:hypothetical protein